MKKSLKKARKNKMGKQLFETICRMQQDELQENLCIEFTGRKKKVYEMTPKGFVFVPGTFPVLLVAHMDTVHKEPVKEVICDKNIISSPQGIGGDDRCGIYMIFKVLQKYDCSVLFCEDEEIGGYGASAFVDHIPELEKKLGHKLEFNYIIEFDRANSNDAVFYDCANEQFTKFITSTGFYQEKYGTFSDISIIAPELKTAAVNLSCGYYKAHTTNEYVDMFAMEASINAAIALLDKTDINKDKFEYIEAADKYDKNWWKSYGTNWDNLSYQNNYKGYYEDDFLITYIDEFDQMMEDTISNALSEDEAVGIFLKEHHSLTYENIISIKSWYDLDSEVEAELKDM